jgi:hypothetical protein
MPPPPGSSLGAEHFNFFSGINDGTEVLLSIQGLNVMVTIDDIYQDKHYSFLNPDIRKGL